MENKKHWVINYRRKFAIIQAARIDLESELNNQKSKLTRNEKILTKHIIKMIDFTFYGDIIDCKKAVELYPLVMAWVNTVFPHLSLTEYNGLWRFVKLHITGQRILFLRNDISVDDPRMQEKPQPELDKNDISKEDLPIIDC